MSIQERDYMRKGPRSVNGKGINGRRSNVLQGQGVDLRILMGTPY